jgi:hypothetical protein
MDDDPDYSSDGEWLVFSSERDTQSTFDSEIFVKQTHPPYRVLKITDVEEDRQPNLGSPVPTLTRTLIGRPGSDHGYDPIHPHAIAAVAAFDQDGYLNFVRLGIPPDRAPNLQVTPLTDVGQNLVGVLISAPDMYYVEQDAGIGAAPRIWDLSRRTSRSILLYLDANTGRLVSILDFDDDTGAVGAAAAGEGITHRVHGASTTVHGSFNRVWDDAGGLVAEGEIGAVEINASKRVVRAF